MNGLISRQIDDRGFQLLQRIGDLMSASQTQDKPVKITKGERTRRRVKEGVRNLLAVRDFDTISIEDVVEETDITVGSIYFHFKSKDGLMTAIAEEDIEQFFAYFDDIGDEDLFSSAFLLAWRSVQQYINRRGHTQLLQWYFNINPDSVSASWLPRQGKLVRGFANLIAANKGREAPDEDDIILAELLFNGMDGLLISQSRLMTSDKLIRGEKPLDLAIRLARSWYRAAGGTDAGKLTPEQRRNVKRIVKSTEMLQRPVRLPPV